MSAYDENERHEDFDYFIAHYQELYPLSSFIVQECNGDESGYTNYILSWQLVGIL